MSLDLLRSNLQEIYASVHQPESSLVPNMAGTRLYDSSRGWGRLWKLFYQLFSCCQAVQSLKERKLQEALNKTSSVFNEELLKVQPPLKAYGEHLDSVCNGYEPREDYTKERREITAWNNATLPFLKLFHSQQNAKLRAIFEQHFPQGADEAEEVKEAEEKEAAAPLPFRADFLKACAAQQSIIDLEGILGGDPLPYEPLARICRGQSLNQGHLAALKTFVEKLMQHENELEVVLLHQALKGLVESACPNIYNEASNVLARLELTLAEQGCTLFSKKDEKHVAWRDSLQPGNEIFCNLRPLVLGPQVGPRHRDDKTMIFEVQELPNQLVMIGVNRAILGIKAELNRKYRELRGHGEPPVVEFMAIDEHGTCALIPKLGESLENIQWYIDSENRISMAPESLARLWLLAQFINELLKMGRTPINLSLRDLRFSEDGREICFLRVPKLDVLDYNALSDFIFAVSTNNSTAVSENNLAIFKQLMEQSGMTRHSIAQFYQLIVENALSKAPRDVQNIVEASGIEDPRVVDRAKTLHADLIALKGRLCGVDCTPAQEVTVCKNLLKQYKQTNAAGILWPRLENVRIAFTIS